jgi:hypothetical protein
LTKTYKGIKKRRTEQITGKVIKPRSALLPKKNNDMAMLAPPPPGMGAENQGAYRDDLNTHMVCPDCKIFPPNLIEDSANADTICGDCGMVLAQRNISYESEWRTFNSDEGKGDGKFSRDLV